MGTDSLFEYIVAAWAAACLVLLVIGYIATCLEAMFGIDDVEQDLKASTKLNSRERAIFGWVAFGLHVVGILGLGALGLFFIFALVQGFRLPAGTLVLPTLFAAIILYRIRGVRPLLYGLIEIAAGVGFILGASASESWGVTKAGALAAGAYFVVRGLDNFEKGLTGRALRIWTLIFPKTVRQN